MKKSFRTFLTAILVCCMVLGLMSPIAAYAQTEETPAASVHSWNLLLADEIAVNFQVDIREVSAGAVMSVTDGYGTTAYSVAQAQKNEAGQYVFTARLAASQLTKPVKLELIDNGEVLLSNTYCAVDYATTVLAGAYPADTKALLSALLHYGAAAQNYFAYNTDSLANAGLPAAAAVPRLRLRPGLARSPGPQPGLRPRCPCWGGPPTRRRGGAGPGRRLRCVRADPGSRRRWPPLRSARRGTS